MLPIDRDGDGMNKPAGGGGAKCKALCTVQYTGHCPT